MIDPTAQLPHAPLPAYYQDESDHAKYVRRIFDETAVDYDRIESAMAFGTKRWCGRALQPVTRSSTWASAPGCWRAKPAP